MKKTFIALVVIAIVTCCAVRALDSGHDNATNVGEIPATGSDYRHYEDLDRVDIPPSVPSLPKTYTGFRLSFNPENHTPNWVGWELLGSETDGPVSRSNVFWQDESLKGCPASESYKNSGYDRGHLCPAADQKWSEQAMSDCFVLANICPQNGALNRGAWQTLEKRERRWAQRDSAIVIVAGPVYEPTDTKTIGADKIRVPSAFFKAFCAPYADPPRTIAFVYPNMSSPGNMQQYVLTVDELEELTGFDFFPNLPDEIEIKIEKTASFKEWDR
ncbi:MAG: DNA/RNA non-specific endonuclease [Muribaculum sp.]|nr:DNA/RNA non-specific endonuclease [Muribaculum sp.]